MTATCETNLAEMDLRYYGLPIRSDYRAYPRARSVGASPEITNRYGYERSYSICDLSLSDDQGSEDMPYWTRSSKLSKSSKRQQGPRHNSSRGPQTKHQEVKKSIAAPASQNPGIDIALRNLYHEISNSLKTFQALVQCFELEIEPLRNWADGHTLDTVWRNKVKTACREKLNRERIQAVAGRIIDTRATLKSAVKSANALKEAWNDGHEIESQIRTAKKGILYCDGIIDLAERAASERLACRQLVSELKEARSLLDRKKHPWICKSASIPRSSQVLGLYHAKEIGLTLHHRWGRPCRAASRRFQASEQFRREEQGREGWAK